MESYANNGPTFGDLTNLGVEKLQELDTVLKTILTAPIAQDIYAQIIDGNPRHPVYPNEKTSSISGNLKPSDRALQEYEKIRKSFASQDLLIDLRVRDSPGSWFPQTELNIARSRLSKYTVG